MALPFGYSLLPGAPTAPPPQGYSYAPGTNGQWYSYPTGADNSVLGGAVSGQGTPQSPASFWTNPLTFDLGPSVDNLLAKIPIIGPLNKFVGSTSDPHSIAGGGGAAAGAAWDFITDIPRVVTTVLGIILIIAGIFALTKGPVVNVVGNVARESLTS